MSKTQVSYQELCDKFCNWTIETGQYRHTLTAAKVGIQGYLGGYEDVINLADTPLARQWNEEFDVIDPKTGKAMPPSEFLKHSHKLFDGRTHDVLKTIIGEKVKGNEFQLMDILGDAAAISKLNPESALENHPNLDLTEFGSASNYIQAFKEKRDFLNKIIANHAVANAGLEKTSRARKHFMEMGSARQSELELLNSSSKHAHPGAERATGTLRHVWHRHVKPAITGLLGLRDEFGLGELIRTEEIAKDDRLKRGQAPSADL